MARDRPASLIRERVARGVLVNSLFTIVLQSLGLVRGFLVAAFLSRTDYGVWGVLIVGLLTVGWLRQFGIADRYLQQDDEDQEVAFQEAFTAELIASVGLAVIWALAVPIFAIVYGESDLLLPGFVMALALPASAFQVGAWVFYRNMDFVRQRVLSAVDPVVGAIAAVALAIAGAGVWAFVGGMFVGAWIAAVAAVWASPYRLRLRLPRRALRAYVHFSLPLVIGAGASAAMMQGTVFTGHAVLGLAGVGAIALASSVSAYADRVDDVLAAALYPAICAMKDRTDLLYESFVKSNRLALIWAAPYGVGLALFAPYLVDLGLGERWRPALELVQAFGLIAAFNHVAFNWGSYYMARAQTRPIAVVKLVSAGAFLAVAIPLLVFEGLTGLAIGLALTTALTIGVRAHYVRQLFPRFRLRAQLVRGFAPTLPAAAAVLAVRWGTDAANVRPAGLGLIEFVLFVAVTLAATAALERRLLGEMLGYLRAGGIGPPRPAPGSTASEPAL
jgi:O-antigen/teichoic acid export membrane protein